MNKRRLIIYLLMVTLLSGCGNTVSQKKYDKVVNELEEKQSELTDLKKEQASEGMSQSGAKAWVVESFGDNAETIIYNNNLYVNIPTGYTISEESIKTLWENVNASLPLYVQYFKTNPEQLPYDSVTIIICEEKTGLDMLSFQFLKNADNTFTKTALMINVENINSISPYIKKALNETEAAQNDKSNTTQNDIDTSSNNQSQKHFSLKHGILLDANPNGGADGNTLVIKAKITSSLTNKMTILQNYRNVADIIRNQDGNTFTCIDYWAVADMTNGNEEKVISFTLSTNTINQIYNAQISDDSIGEYADNLFIHPSLQ